MSTPTEAGWYWAKMDAHGEPLWQPVLFNGVGDGVSYGHRGPFAEWAAADLVIEWGPRIPEPDELRRQEREHDELVGIHGGRG